MKIHTTIQKWGNSLAIRIKRKSLFFNEAQLLKGLTFKKAHADEIAKSIPQDDNPRVTKSE
ncbi:MAG: hypothetical protein ACD_60C00070G0008 [uncultured bacterium]|nr:MAG: hypothetical protein ACD_60C00070G0008 [uncultured bacterium]